MSVMYRNNVDSLLGSCRGLFIYQPVPFVYSYSWESLTFYVHYNASDSVFPNARSAPATVTFDVFEVNHHPNVTILPAVQPILSPINANPKTQETTFQVLLASVDRPYRGQSSLITA